MTAEVPSGLEPTEQGIGGRALRRRHVAGRHRGGLGFVVRTPSIGERFTGINACCPIHWLGATAGVQRCEDQSVTLEILDALCGPLAIAEGDNGFGGHHQCARSDRPCGDRLSDAILRET